jgi:hypothetical protein
VKNVAVLILVIVLVPIALFGGGCGAFLLVLDDKPFLAVVVAFGSVLALIGAAHLAISVARPDVEPPPDSPEGES